MPAPTVFLPPPSRPITRRAWGAPDADEDVRPPVGHTSTGPGRSHPRTGVRLDVPHPIPGGVGGVPDSRAVTLTQTPRRGQRQAGAARVVATVPPVSKAAVHRGTLTLSSRRGSTAAAAAHATTRRPTRGMPSVSTARPPPGTPLPRGVSGLARPTPARPRASTS